MLHGGGDNTIGFARYDYWYDNPNVLEGKDSPDGPTSASFAVSHVRDHAPIHVDVIGVGASTYDFLKQSGIHVVPVDVRNAATSFDRSGQLSFTTCVHNSGGSSEKHWTLHTAAQLLCHLNQSF